jgi:hypothetical protein
MGSRAFDFYALVGVLVGFVAGMFWPLWLALAIIWRVLV